MFYIKVTSMKATFIYVMAHCIINCVYLKFLLQHDKNLYLLFTLKLLHLQYHITSSVFGKRGSSQKELRFS